MALSIVKPADEVLREVFLNTEIKGRALYHQILSFEQIDEKDQCMQDLYQVKTGNLPQLEREYKALG